MYIFGWNISQKRMNRSVFPEWQKVTRKAMETSVAGSAASTVILMKASERFLYHQLDFPAAEIDK